MSRIFLTGASGYVGSALGRALTAAGASVLGLTRSTAGRAAVEAYGGQPVVGDMTDPSGWIEAAAQCDGAVHTAVVWGPDGPAADARAVDALLQALAGSGKPLIYTSGSLVYGDTSSDVADERGPLSPPPFAAWKAEGDAQVRHAEGTRGIAVRPGGIHGLGEGPVKGQIARARAEGVARYVGEGLNQVGFVDVEDLADLYVAALDRAPPGAAYAAFAETIEHREVAHAIARATGVPAEAWPLDRAYAVLGPFAEAATLDCRVDVRWAAQELGWRPHRPGVIEDIESGSYANG